MLLDNNQFQKLFIDIFWENLPIMHQPWISPRGVLRISSDGDDRMELKVKTQKNP